MSIGVTDSTTPVKPDGEHKDNREQHWRSKRHGFLPLSQPAEHLTPVETANHHMEYMKNSWPALACRW
jgi:hypothetical protein